MRDDRSQNFTCMHTRSVLAEVVSARPGHIGVGSERVDGGREVVPPPRAERVLRATGGRGHRPLRHIVMAGAGKTVGGVRVDVGGGLEAAGEGGRRARPRLREDAVAGRASFVLSRANACTQSRPRRRWLVAWWWRGLRSTCRASCRARHRAAARCWRVAAWPGAAAPRAAPPAATSAARGCRCRRRSSSSRVRGIVRAGG